MHVSLQSGWPEKGFGKKEYGRKKAAGVAAAVRD